MAHEPEKDAYDDPTIKMLDTLPAWFDDGTGTPNHDLLEPIGSELRKIEDDLVSIEDAMLPQTAKTKDQLQGMADLVGLVPTEGESLEHYRARILAEFQVVTSNGTIPDLLWGMSNIFGVKVTSIGPYEENTSGGQASLTVPKGALDKTELTESEVAGLATKLVPAPYFINAFQSGDLEFVTPTTYDNVENGTDSWDNYPGYDGLSTDVPQDFTSSTLPTGWTLGGAATYDDVNDRVELNPKTSNTSGNAQYDSGLGTLRDWRVNGTFYVDGGADEFTINLYADSPGTTANSTAGYQVKYDHFNSAIELKDLYAGTILTSTSVSIADSATSHAFSVSYDSGTVEVWLDGLKYIDYTISAPDYTNSGLSFGGWCGGTAGLHALSDFHLLGGSPKGNGGTFTTIIQ